MPDIVEQISDTKVPLQDHGKLARSRYLNLLAEKINLLLNAEGRNGIKVQVSEGNILISLDESTITPYTLTVCEIVNGTPTAVDVTLARILTEED